MNRLGCYILLVFCSIGWWQDISRADQIPFLDVINNAGSLELKVFMILKNPNGSNINLIMVPGRY